MSAEWCDTDPVERVVTEDDQKITLHVTAYARLGEEKTLKRWKHGDNTSVLWEDGRPYIEVHGPTCEYRIKVEDRAGKYTLGDDQAIHGAGTVVRVPVVVPASAKRAAARAAKADDKPE